MPCGKKKKRKKRGGYRASIFCMRCLTEHPGTTANCCGQELALFKKE